MMKGRLLFYSCLICLLHWGKQMIMSPYGEFRFLFDIQINSLPRFIYFCHCWNGWLKKKKKAMLLCHFSVSWPSLLDRKRKPTKYVYFFNKWRMIHYRCPYKSRSIKVREVRRWQNQTKQQWGGHESSFSFWYVSEMRIQFSLIYWKKLKFLFLFLSSYRKTFLVMELKFIVLMWFSLWHIKHMGGVGY